ncbi:hypothetical protein SAMN06309944_2364 [Micrococcales bacterium KH10]|nr:hypothetical protein SAMN06309944_2364 [Micrococcales bacterium KH10]
MRKTVLVVSIIVLTALFAVGAVIFVLDRTVPAPTVAQRCRATVDGTAWSLDVEQSSNAALIGIQPLVRSMPARAGTIGLATAYQESKIRNIDYGDRDSLGLFQQRPSQGWGTPEQVMDPVYSTNAFYDGLAKIDDYVSMPVTDAAQAVQRSAFPLAYARHEPMGRAWASALNGYSEAVLTCRLGDVPADVDATAALRNLDARISRDIPVTAETTAKAGRQLTVSVRATTKALDLRAAERTRVGWAIAQWAVAVAAVTDIDAVQYRNWMWTRNTGDWHEVSNSPTDVVLSVGGSLTATPEP